MPSDAQAMQTSVILSTFGTEVRFPGALSIIQTAVEGDLRDPQLLFTFAVEHPGDGIVISRNSDPIRSTAPHIDAGTGHTLVARAPLSPSTAILLIGSGLVSAGATRRRRRGVRRWHEIKSPFGSGKEVASRAPYAPSRTAQGSSYSTPLRI